MNLLVDALPTQVEVAGRMTPIRWDFRVGVLMEALIFDPQATEREKVSLALELYYPKVPANLTDAVERMLWFYRCGQEESGTGSGEGGIRRVYDFEQDAPYIYAAFAGQYGMDLNTVDDLHWWKFRALFTGLTQEQEIVKIMRYRAIRLGSIKDKEQRRHYAKLQALYRLKGGLSEQEKAARAGAMFAGGLG